MLPAVTRVTLCYPVTQTQSSKFAFKLDVFVSLCYLRLPLLPCYPNIDQYICNLSCGISAPVLPAVTRVTLLPTQYQQIL